MREPNVDNGCEGKTTNDYEMTRWSLVASWSLSSGDVKLITSWHKRRSGTSRGEAQAREGRTVLGKWWVRPTDQLALLLPAPPPSCLSLSLRIPSVALSAFSQVALDLPAHQPTHLPTYLATLPQTCLPHAGIHSVESSGCLSLQSQLKLSCTLSGKPVPNQNRRSCNRLAFVTLQTWFDLRNNCIDQHFCHLMYCLLQ